MEIQTEGDPEAFCIYYLSCCNFKIYFIGDNSKVLNIIEHNGLYTELSLALTAFGTLPTYITAATVHESGTQSCNPKG